MNGIRHELVSCTTYHYSDSQGLAYQVIPELKAPKAGDQSAADGASATTGDGIRSDIHSFVRVGRVVNNEFVQISDRPVQSQVSRLVEAQALATTRVAKTAPKASKSSAASSTPAAPKGNATAVTTDCDLLTPAELESAFGVAFMDGVEQSGFECLFGLAQGAGGVAISAKAAADGGSRFYSQLAKGESAQVPGAADAKYATNTNRLGQNSETISVLTKKGNTFSITVQGDDAPQAPEAQMIVAASTGVRRFDGKA